MQNIAIIGSGPTAIYTAHYLLAGGAPISITMFETQDVAGKGSPYHPKWNTPLMLSNIASIEIPPIGETLVEWLARQDDEALARMGIARDEIDERTFYPRVTLGEYFHAQLKRMQGPQLTVRAGQHVEDVRSIGGAIEVCLRGGGCELFDQVVMATGHSLPRETEIRPGYFISAWAPQALRTIGNVHVGIRGTSLSGIDAAVALAQARGTFRRDAKGVLEYLPEPETQNFRMTMMSRKGILPEADFYHPIPYEPLSICTVQAVDRLIAHAHPDGLLDEVFALFKAELAICDPAYARSMKLERLTLDTFTERYFAQRARRDPFDWAKRNLAEAQRNEKRRHTVPWRYAILRMHEVIGRIVRHLPPASHARFQQFKPVFVDDYATVPHLSIERLLALHHAGKLDVLELGNRYELDTRASCGGAVLNHNGIITWFPAFIDATGQRCLGVDDFPFPSLWQQGLIRSLEGLAGVALDACYQPVSSMPDAKRLYCLCLPFMLAQFPFAQGITSSHDMGRCVAGDILAQQSMTEPQMGRCHDHETFRRIHRG